MTLPEIVDRERWLAASTELVAKEKALTRPARQAGGVGGAEGAVRRRAVRLT